MLRLGDHENGAVLLSRKSSDEELQSDGEGECLVCLLATEGHELLWPRSPLQHVPVGHGSHRHVGDERLAVTRGNGDRERIRTRERRAS